MSAFFLMILVGTSRSWEALEISSPRVTFLTSSRLTFSKQNLQPELSSLILRTLGCFSKLLIAFTVGSLCSLKIYLEISQLLILRPSTLPSKQDRKISATSFSSEMVVLSSFSSFSVFSVNLGFTVFPKDVLSVILLTLRFL